MTSTLRESSEPEGQTKGSDTPVLVVDGRGIMTAGRTPASPRPPSMRLLGSALADIRRRFQDRHVVTVIGTDLVDAVEHDEQPILDKAIEEGLVVTVPSSSPQAVLSVAQQLDAVVISMDDLTRLRVPHSWLAQKGRFVKLARVERNWVFV
ncbi:hypothetical protein [Streptomyces tropicalis]|uniref:NYN domain-containing protein n=1 Tax=Streptomyces tropicalis TaxID=3034234 RepID=A0ABT6AC97_9ACTN|nr:hypothetical protein [Streptomyces tropicalis]MDF3302062.1 hypothetical protein [Streptomyces tropicalis]